MPATKAESDPREKMLKRLRRLEGQIRGIQTMIEEGRECYDILTQIMAVRAALEGVAFILVENYLENCIYSPDEGLNRDKLMKTLQLFLKKW